MNETAQMAIRTPWELAEREIMKNVIIVTVWGSLFCRGIMEKLGK